ncbi:MAG: response regulator [Pseudobutyrivibrio sp.]|nr:response regulator [Pseudobutyrivibrio sp.]
MKVLIVEDEIRIREGLVKLLSKFDDKYEIVDEASDGQQGLELSKKYRPDIIITDIKMPNMDGLEMLSAIYGTGMKTKAIVISAYSEFEYARGAMRLGVTEYLLKPVSLADFSQALDNISEQIAEDNRKKPEQVGTLEQIFRDVVLGHRAPSTETVEYLKNAYDITSNQNFFVVCAYLGNSFEDKREDKLKFLRQAFSSYGQIKYTVLDSQYHKSIIMLVYSYKDGHDIERFIQYQLLKQVDSDIVVGCEELAGIEGLVTGINDLYPYMDWNISFEEGIVISYPKITQVQTTICIYPIDIENQIKTAIFARDEDKVNAAVKSFHNTFLDGKIYNPRELKECYVRFLWTILEVGKEAGCRQDGSIKRQNLLDKIMNSKTHEELNHICDKVLADFEFKAKKSSSNHLVVRKAEGLIQEFYNTGITLDEIASKMNITPEYLGTQFHKETGMTYSAYLKNFRITKAKELLISTNMKLYEIADKVGYQDPKYFSKVFREVTGQLPAEYRRTIK